MMSGIHHGGDGDGTASNSTGISRDNNNNNKEMKTQQLVLSNEGQIQNQQPNQEQVDQNDNMNNNTTNNNNDKLDVVTYEWVLLVPPILAQEAYRLLVEYKCVTRPWHLDGRYGSRTHRYTMETNDNHNTKDHHLSTTDDNNNNHENKNDDAATTTITTTTTNKNDKNNSPNDENDNHIDTSSLRSSKTITITKKKQSCLSSTLYVGIPVISKEMVLLKADLCCCCCCCCCCLPSTCSQDVDEVEVDVEEKENNKMDTLYSFVQYKHQYKNQIDSTSSTTITTTNTTPLTDGTEKEKKDTRTNEINHNPPTCYNNKRKHIHSTSVPNTVPTASSNSMPEDATSSNNIVDNQNNNGMKNQIENVEEIDHTTKSILGSSSSSSSSSSNSNTLRNMLLSNPKIHLIYKIYTPTNRKFIRPPFDATIHPELRPTSNNTFSNNNNININNNQQQIYQQHQKIQQHLTGGIVVQQPTSTCRDNNTSNNHTTTKNNNNNNMNTIDQPFHVSQQSSVTTTTTTTTKFTYMELFAGIGGFTVALEKLGGTCIFVSEMDRTCQKMWTRNFMNHSSSNYNTDATSNETNQSSNNNNDTNINNIDNNKIMYGDITKVPDEVFTALRYRRCNNKDNQYQATTTTTTTSTSTTSETHSAAASSLSSSSSSPNDEKQLVEVDILVGGFPCQPFSALGQQPAFTSTTTSTTTASTNFSDITTTTTVTNDGLLYLEIVRVLHLVQPRTFLFENVPGLKSLSYCYNTILKALQDCHYQVTTEIIDARTLTATTRKRLYFVGIRNDLIIIQNQQPQQQQQESMNPAISTVNHTTPNIFQFPFIPDLGLRARDVISYNHQKQQNNTTTHTTKKSLENNTSNTTNNTTTTTTTTDDDKMIDDIPLSLLMINDEQVQHLHNSRFWKPSHLCWPDTVCSTLVSHYGHSIQRGHSQLIPRHSRSSSSDNSSTCGSTNQDDHGNPRMYTPRECARLMGFPNTYDIPVYNELEFIQERQHVLDKMREEDANDGDDDETTNNSENDKYQLNTIAWGPKIHLKQQYRMFGNAVCPPVIAVLVGAIFGACPPVAQKHQDHDHCSPDANDVAQRSTATISSYDNVDWISHGRDVAIQLAYDATIKAPPDS